MRRRQRLGTDRASVEADHSKEQAIARCHRMGQVRPVEVHRLLTGNSEWSVIKDATPEAIDVAADRSTIKVATQAVQERRIIEFERRRLGLDAYPST